jgi:hypothetical protein
MPKHVGPYLIQQCGPNFTYRLIDIKTQLPLKGLVNAARLKLYVKPKPKLSKVIPPAREQVLHQPMQSETAHTNAGSSLGDKETNGEDLFLGKIIKDRFINGKKHYQFEGSRDWIHMDKCHLDDIQNYLIRKANRKPSQHEMKTRSKTYEM